MSEKEKEPDSGGDLVDKNEVWEKIVQRPEFGQLLSAKARFIVPACAFFLIYYFALIILVGYFPDFAKKRIGPANLAYWFALSQFFMAWIVAWIYVRAAGRFDRLAQAILAEHAPSDSSKK